MDNFQNFDQTTTPKTIDSRDDHSENKAQKFFHVLFAFLVSIIIIISGVFVLINVKFYNIEYISTLQWLMSMLPAMGLFYGFYYIAGERNMTVCFIPITPLLSNEVFCCPECRFGIKVDKYNEHRIISLINWLE